MSKQTHSWCGVPDCGCGGDPKQGARQAFEAMRGALHTFIGIYPDKVRAHPDVKIAIGKARAALALADKVSK